MKKREQNPYFEKKKWLLLFFDQPKPTDICTSILETKKNVHLFCSENIEFIMMVKC